ncbi:MAG: aminopeptidase [Planctomycetes bacterium]|nr:aminopeptidase [Planctomycetota bacterium]
MKVSPNWLRFAGLALLIFLLPLTACDGLVYVLHAAEGQFGIQGATEPIEDVLASGRLSEEDDAKLRLLVRARKYAIETIGLNAGESYTTFFDSAGDPIVFSLSASPEDALEPVIWWFPFFGDQEHLLFFDEEYLRQIEQELIDAGFDTYTYEVDAYSTAGFFKDPIRSPMLQRHTLSAVETIFHELLHNTIWQPGEPVFNESLATFVGRTAAAEFLLAEFGQDSGWGEVAEAYYGDTDAVNTFLLELYDGLAAYYAGPLSAEEKAAGREAVYQAGRDRFVDEVLPTLNYPDVFAGYANLPTNNAWMRANYRYHLDLAVLEEVFTVSGGDWPAVLDLFRAAARSSENPFDYLRNWLAEHGG